MPMAAYVGTTAMTIAAPAIMPMVRVRPFLRPWRSAYAPRMAPPIGRITNPTAKIASVESRFTAGSSLPKNWPANTGASVA